MSQGTRSLLLGLAFACACSANDDIPAPQISSIVPDRAPAGSIVNVSGAYFCQRPDTGNEDPTCALQGAVHFGPSPGTPTTWNDNSIMVEIPQGVLGLVAVSVSIAGRTSNSVAFTAE